MKAIPREDVTEAVQKRYDDPTKVMLLITVKYNQEAEEKKKHSYSKSAVLKLASQIRRHSLH